jgi:hypothetical protein
VCCGFVNANCSRSTTNSNSSATVPGTFPELNYTTIASIDDTTAKYTIISVLVPLPITTRDEPCELNICTT